MNFSGDDTAKISTDELDQFETDRGGGVLVADELDVNTGKDSSSSLPESIFNMQQLTQAIKKIVPKKKSSALTATGSIPNNSSQVDIDQFKYVYEDSFFTEINEFFDSNDKYLLKDVLSNVRHESHLINFNDLPSSQKMEQLELIQEQLEINSIEIRTNALKQLLFIALGSFKEDSLPPYTSKLNQLQFYMYENNSLLLKHKFLFVYHRLLLHCLTLLKDSSNDYSKSICLEMEIILCLLFMIIHSTELSTSNTSEEVFEFIDLEPSFNQTISGILLLLNDANNATAESNNSNTSIHSLWYCFLPVKKLFILNWRCFVCLCGPIDEIKIPSNSTINATETSAQDSSQSSSRSLKKAVREEIYKIEQVAIDFDENRTSPKLFYSDYSKRIQEIKEKFPSNPATIPSFKSPYLDILQKFYPFTHGFHFDSTTPNEANSSPVESYQNQFVPYWCKAADEQLELMKKHLHISPGQIQFAEYQRKIQQFDQVAENDIPTISNWIEQSDERNIQAARLAACENFFRKTFESLASQLVLILKVLLSVNSSGVLNDINTVSILIQIVFDSINSNNSRASHYKAKVEDGNIRNESVLMANSISYLELKRNQEVVSKAILFYLLYLLKHSKSYHVLQFEYISQLLVDANCLLLIMKIINQDLSLSILNNNTDLEEFLFTHYYFKICSSSSNSYTTTGSNNTVPLRKASKADSISSDATMIQEEGKLPTVNIRCFLSAINIMRILQKLTKRKQQRLNVLIQYKFGAIMKKSMKVSHGVLNFYNYKLLKSVIPFMNKKWKQANMKLVTGVYKTVRSDLVETWLNGTGNVLLNSSVNAANATNFSIINDKIIEEAQNEEGILRSLIALYVQKYQQKCSTSKSDLLNRESTFHYSQEMNQMKVVVDEVKGIEDDEAEEIELDELFMQNYEQWLEDEVFSVGEESGSTEDYEIEYNFDFLGSEGKDQIVFVRNEINF